MTAPFVPFVVNMIPRSLSGETHQDSEPHLTVNPVNPQQIVGTAFTPPPTPGPDAPIFVSLNGGRTWFLNNVVPSVTGSNAGTGDITTSFNGSGTRLYAAILRDSSRNLEFYRTSNFSTAVTMSSIAASRPNADQPFTHATTAGGTDRLYVGDNDFNAVGGMTQTLDQSLNADGVTPVLTSIRVEKRTTASQDGPQCRPISHPDGTVYAAYYGWRSKTGNFAANTLIITADVVVVRDDAGGSGATPFAALVDPLDHLAGIRVARSVTFPFNQNGAAATGQQRIGGSISIAVDPRNSSTVYLVWGDRQTGSFLTLHVRRSTDRGATWSATDLLTVDNATNASLAVNDDGVVGLLCQQLVTSGSTRQWITRVSLGQDGTAWNHFVLAQTLATQPVKTFDPYLGDYDHLLALGRDFYGIFSANNMPSRGNFPFGVSYQRNADFATARLLNLNNVSPVPISIDPFFFHLTQNAAAISIVSAQFGTFLRMDAPGVTQPAASGGGTVNSAAAADPFTRFRLLPLQDETFAVESLQFPDVFLRLDGSAVTQPLPQGGGVMNCQFGNGPMEKFSLVPQGDGTLAIESVAFPGVFVRTDGSIVNAQRGIGPMERFRVVSV
jgi:hypothetical protein